MLERSSTLTWIDGLQEMNSVSDLLDSFDAVATPFGIDGLALSRGGPAGNAQITHISLSAEGRMVHIESEQIVASHSAACRVVSARNAIGWVRTKPDDHRSYSPLTWGQVSHAAFESGVSVPTRTTDGFEGTVSVLPAERAPGGQDVVRMVMLAVAIHARVERLDVRARSVVALSEREHQVIAWLAEGKSADDVAAIMGISNATVMFHYRKVALKFGTLNRTHTVVEAFRRGELHLAEPQPAPQVSAQDYII